MSTSCCRRNSCLRRSTVHLCVGCLQWRFMLQEVGRRTRLALPSRAVMLMSALLAARCKMLDASWVLCRPPPAQLLAAAAGWRMHTTTAQPRRRPRLSWRQRLRASSLPNEAAASVHVPTPEMVPAALEGECWEPVLPAVTSKMPTSAWPQIR